MRERALHVDEVDRAVAHHAVGDVDSPLRAKRTSDTDPSIGARASAMAEGVRPRERLPHGVVPRHPPRERAEGLERRDEDVAVVPTRS